MSLHLAFGLVWQSHGLPIGELPPFPTDHRGPASGVDAGPIAVKQEEPGLWPQLPVGQHDTPFLQMARGDLRLTVEEIGRFRISGGDHIAWQRENEAVSDQDIRTFLLGSAVGALLIQRGMLVLHGNALAKDG